MIYSQCPPKRRELKPPVSAVDTPEATDGIPDGVLTGVFDPELIVDAADAVEEADIVGRAKDLRAVLLTGLGSEVLGLSSSQICGTKLLNQVAQRTYIFLDLARRPPSGSVQNFRVNKGSTASLALSRFEVSKSRRCCELGLIKQTSRDYQV